MELLIMTILLAFGGEMLLDGVSSMIPLYEAVCVTLQVNLVLDDGRSLGLMIRGGAEYALGIYITGVDWGSAAELGGLKVQMHSYFVLTDFLLQYLFFIKQSPSL